MNWDAVRAIGEILGAIAVFLSLSYLAAQIRNQNREARLSAMREMSLGFRTSTAKLLDSGLTEIFIKCMDSFDVLTDEEKLKLIIGITAVFRAWEEAYIQHEMGNLDDRVWSPMLSYYTLILSSPAGQNVWKLRKQHFDQEFRDFADALELMEYSLA